MDNYTKWVEFKMEMEHHNDVSRAALRQKNRNSHLMQSDILKEGPKPADFGVFVTLEELHEKTSLPSDDCLTLRTSIIRSLQNVVPAEERNSSGCCVIVSLEELRTVRSFSPCDYMIKGQVDMIIKVLMQCKTIFDIQNTVQGLLMRRKISNGTRFLTLKPAVLTALHQYSVISNSRNALVSKLG